MVSTTLPTQTLQTAVFFSRWEQAGYALWSCNAASSNLFHWSTVGENKPRNENKRLRASNISFFQKIVGYKYFMRRIFFIYVLFKDISDTQCSLVRNCEWLFFFFFYKMIHRSPQNPLFPPVCTNLFSFLHPSFFPRRLCEHLSSLSFILMHSQIQDKTKCLLTTKA